MTKGFMFSIIVSILAIGLSMYTKGRQDGFNNCYRQVEPKP